jgi:hypothetical protein
VPNNKGVIPEKWLTDTNKYYLSRFEVPDRASLVRIPPQTWQYERSIIHENNNGGPDVIRTRDPRHVKAVS